VVVASLRPLAATHLQHEFENLEMNLNGSKQKKEKKTSTISARYARGRLLKKNIVNLCKSLEKTIGV